MRDRERPTGPANPFEAYLLLACAIQGAVVLAGIARPGSVHAALPPVLVTLWALLLTIGGLAGLAGLYWLGDPFSGVEVKRVGLVSAGVGTLVYGCSALLLGPVGLAAGISNLLFSVACLTRLLQVSARLRMARRHMNEPRVKQGG